MIIDRYWNILMANEAMQRITEILLMIRACSTRRELISCAWYYIQGVRKHIENIVEFELYMASRVSRALNSIRRIKDASTLG